MTYFISFLEGIITFISPCLLPMLPIYISYFSNGKSSLKNTIFKSIAFVLGFTTIFILLGAFASSIGVLLKQYRSIVNIITGSIVVIFGLSFLNIIHINIFKGIKHEMDLSKTTLLSSFIFGIIFSIGWSPCVGAFLGSALMLASSSDTIIQGILMLLCYSMGLGIPFILSAILIDNLKSTFLFIKKHYDIINKISGMFLIVLGIFMMFGILEKIMTLLS